MADTLATVTAKVRAKLNDKEATQYTDSYLVTYVGMAQSELDAWMRSKGFEKYRSEAPIAVSAGTTEISFGGDSALPDDFAQPVVMHERPLGSTRASDWVQMVQTREGLPTNLEPRESLGYWTWRAGKILLLGATTDREVLLDYLNVPPEVAVPTDVLPMIDSAEALAYLTASMVCTSVGASQAAAEFYRGTDPNRVGGFLAARDVLYSAAMRQKQRRVLRRKFYYPGRTPRPNYVN